MWLVLIGLLSGVISENAYSYEQVRTICPAASFVGEPALNSQGYLEAKLVSHCQLMSGSSMSIESLNRNLLEDTSNRFTVHRGPIGETYEGLSSQYFDVTAQTNQENGTVVMRRDIHIATDFEKRLANVSLATQIQGSGNAAYLRHLDYRQDVKKVSDGTFRVTLTQSVQIEKPWYAPEKMFISQAKKSLADSFEKDVQKDIQVLGKMLQD